MIGLNTKLNKNLQKIVKEIATIDDIILFGSVVRGKENPRDTDILIIFKEKINKEEEYLIRKKLEKYFPNVAVISKTKNSLYEPSFDAREAILLEGISLVSGKKIAEKYGLSSLGLFKYDFEKWNKLTQTKFYYALNGRGKETGFLQKIGGIKLSNKIVLVPLDKTEKMKEFLSSWKFSYKYIPLLLPERLNKKTILTA